MGTALLSACYLRTFMPRRQRLHLLVVEPVLCLLAVPLSGWKQAVTVWALRTPLAGVPNPSHPFTEMSGVHNNVIWRAQPKSQGFGRLTQALKES